MLAKTLSINLNWQKWKKYDTFEKKLIRFLSES